MLKWSRFGFDNSVREGSGVLLWLVWLTDCQDHSGRMALDHKQTHWLVIVV